MNCCKIKLNENVENGILFVTHRNVTLTVSYNTIQLLSSKEVHSRNMYLLNGSVKCLVAYDPFSMNHRHVLL